MKKKLLFLTALLAALAAEANTKIMFLFDTEDYTCDRSNDAIRDIANMLSSEGVRGNFNVVGYLATRLLELKRHDVIDALKSHVIGSQTLYHTRHPDMAELGDNPTLQDCRNALAGVQTQKLTEPDLPSMTLAELRDYASMHEIHIPSSARTKAQIVEAINGDR